MPGDLGVWVESLSSDSSGETVAECCSGSKAGAEQVGCRGGE